MRILEFIRPDISVGIGGKHVITSATVAGTSMTDSFIFLLLRRQIFLTDISFLTIKQIVVVRASESFLSRLR